MSGLHNIIYSKFFTRRAGSNSHDVYCMPDVRFFVSEKSRVQDKSFASIDHVSKFMSFDKFWRDRWLKDALGSACHHT